MATCAIADVGSNTMRLSIYQYDAQGFKLLLGKKENAGLAGYVKDGALSGEGIQVACRVLEQFRSLLENLNVGELHAFATASLRNISNTGAAVDAIRSATGVEVQVISGGEEAALSFRGALSGAAEIQVPGLVVDIGGGSTELVLYDAGGIRSATSLPMGSLSLYTKHVSGLFPTPEEAKAIRQAVKEELRQAGAGETPCPLIYGVGGSIRAAGKLCGKEGVASAQEIRALYHKLKKGDKAVLRQILRACPDRIHTILPGLIILNTLVKTYQAQAVAVCSQGVREGYLLKYVMEQEASHGPTG